jgi:hypothetical protein
MAVEEPRMTADESGRKRKEWCSRLRLSGNDKLSGKNVPEKLGLTRSQTMGTIRVQGVVETGR